MIRKISKIYYTFNNATNKIIILRNVSHLGNMKMKNAEILNSGFPKYDDSSGGGGGGRRRRRCRHCYRRVCEPHRAVNVSLIVVVVIHR